MKLADGCPGCNTLWSDMYAEGQCLKCKRCLRCCGKAEIKFTCASRDAFRFSSGGGPGKVDPAKSRKAYEQWLWNANILRHNRRVL